MRSRLFLRNRESGTALLSVLWVLLLLAGLAASASYMARANALLTQRSLQEAKTEAATDSAVIATISKLTSERATDHSTADGSPISLTIDGINVNVVVTKEGGRIDVNTADDNLITMFLQFKGVSAEQAESMLRELRARQSAGALTIKKEGLSNVLPDSELGRQPFKDPLTTLEELREYPSWGQSNLDCWLPSLTVYSRLTKVSIEDAVPDVLMAIRWGEQHEVGGGKPLLANSMPPNDGEQSLLGVVVRIEASASLSPTASGGSVWVGRLTGNRDHPTLTMKWDHNLSAASKSCLHT